MVNIGCTFRAEGLCFISVYGSGISGVGGWGYGFAVLGVGLSVLQVILSQLYLPLLRAPRDDTLLTGAPKVIGLL